eukprot:8207333-Lingulodinium_polyedra.AAC.2
MPGSGMNRTALAAVYPNKLAEALAGAIRHGPAAVRALWSCPRCKHGLFSPGPSGGEPVATPPHTKLRGCRLAPSGPAEEPPAAVEPLIPVEPAAGEAAQPAAEAAAVPEAGVGEPAPPPPLGPEVAAPEAAEEDEARLRHGVPVYVEPSFNWRHMRQRLDNTDVSKEEKLAILLGLHFKFWHAGAAELQRMLKRGSYSEAAVALVPAAVAQCSERARWKRTRAKPLIKTTLALHFNDR